MKKILGLLLVLCFSNISFAGFFHPYSEIEVLYDCVDGPGWMRVTMADRFGNRRYRQIFIGSKQECRDQAVGLRENRSLIIQYSTIAICSATPTYMVRWTLDPVYGYQNLPSLYYKDKKECLADALALIRQ